MTFHNDIARPLEACCVSATNCRVNLCIENCHFVSPSSRATAHYSHIQYSLEGVVFGSPQPCISSLSSSYSVVSDGSSHTHTHTYIHTHTQSTRCINNRSSSVNNVLFHTTLYCILQLLIPIHNRSSVYHRVILYLYYVHMYGVPSLVDTVLPLPTLAATPILVSYPDPRTSQQQMDYITATLAHWVWLIDVCSSATRLCGSNWNAGSM